MARDLPTRRQVLGALGGLGLGGVFPLLARADTGGKRLIVVHADGGWDPTYCLDPKPGLVDGPYPDEDPDDPDDREEIGVWGEIKVACNARRRPNVNRFFENWAHRTTIVPGLWAGTLSHWEAKDRMLAGTGTDGKPDLTAIVGGTLGLGLPLGSVDLGGTGRPGPFASSVARGGVRGQLRALLAPEERFPMGDGAPRPRAGLGDEDWAAIDAWRSGRTDGARDAALAHAQTMWAEREGLLGALPTGRRDSLAEDLELAADLLRAGTCQAVLVATSRSWDTHADAWNQHAPWNEVMGGLGTLARRLEADGALDDTLVVALSEFGRTPFRNAEHGTDHWPYTAALLFGSDTAGRRSLAGTDDQVVGLPCDQVTGRPTSSGWPMRHDSFAAGVLAAVGVDPEPWLPGVPALRGFRS